MDSVTIIQGDQYDLPVWIHDGPTNITPTMVEEVVVHLGQFSESYPDGNLTFDQTLQRWMFPMTQTQSLAVCGKVNYQVEVVLTTGDIVHSREKTIVVDKSSFRRRHNVSD